jgi:hypothetical protein
MFLPLKPRFHGPVHCVVRSSPTLRQESTLFAMMLSLPNIPQKPPFLADFTDVQSRSADRQNEGAGTEGPAGPLEPWRPPSFFLSHHTELREHASDTVRLRSWISRFGSGEAAWRAVAPEVSRSWGSVSMATTNQSAIPLLWPSLLTERLRTKIKFLQVGLYLEFTDDMTGRYR